MRQGEVVEVVEKEQLPVEIAPEPHSEEVKADVLQAVEEESEDGSKGEKILADEDVVSSVRVEGEGVAQGGSADSGDNKISVNNIVASESRVKLAEVIKVDRTLATARALADQIAEGYHWNQGLLFRTRLDMLGDSREQLCLPLPYRSATPAATKCVCILRGFSTGRP